jgi:hydrogenase nickel incorporation protein HypB
MPGEKPPRYSGGEAKHPHDHDHDHPHEHPHAHDHSHPHDHDHPHEHEHEHKGGLTHSHPHHHDHEHGHSHSHTHDHEHPHEHSHDEAGESRRTVEIRRAILAKNDLLAERNRGFFLGRGLLALNVVSSPGSGKTTFLRETIKMLGPSMKTGVIVGDLATENDALRLREAGAPVVQVTTGTVCHLEAEMVAKAVGALPAKDLRLLIIENVGNLVCPASYDLGENLRVVLLSVTEGEDKPLKYPPIFQSAHVVIVSKIDLAEACEFNRETALANIRRMAPGAMVFETSARKGTGMREWCDFLRSRADRSTAS